jgi:peptidoglycan/LPS O-acetylase OafA/YrhL
LGGGNVVQKLFTFASIVTLVTTLLVIFLFFNGTDIVEETYFFPTIMLGFLLSIVFGWKIKNQKTKSIILWTIGCILAILFLVQIIFVFLWTSRNP